LALRLIEVFLPKEHVGEAQDALEEKSVHGVWQDRILGNQVLLRVLVSTEESEGVLDLLEKRFSSLEGFRMMLLPVEAAIPRPAAEEAMPAKKEPAEAKPPKMFRRLSREELHADVSEMAKLTNVFLVMVVISAIVAAVGILRNNVVFVIGAMVIAPLLGPNVGMSLATTLGDMALAHRALKTNLTGIVAALAVSAIVGLVVSVKADQPGIAERTVVGWSDIIVALGSGAAGALALTTGLPTVVVGVMVAVALLPPLVTFGLLIGGGHFALAMGALYLFLANLICVNLAGTVTFLAQGIRPLTWWEADQARRAARAAITVWVLLLLALLLVLVLSRGIR